MSDSRIYVCETCIEDSDLQEVVRKHCVSEQCDYCGRLADQPIACELSDVLDRIRFVVGQYYTDPNNFMFSENSEWVGQTVYEGDEVLECIGWEVANESLMADIRGAFGDEAFADPCFWPGPPHERQMNSWGRFRHIVKHQRRYTFWSVANDPAVSISEWQPNEMLPSIAETIRAVELTTILNPGTEFWRVRVHDCKETLNRARDFTTPPSQKAIYPNRMSPSGISMFYGADDFETAALETIDPSMPKRSRVTGVAFQNVVPLYILDLTAIPKQFGFFSDRSRQVREAVEFLGEFTNDISKPIKKDGTQHTEYVPTQVFTEFIRYEFQTPEGQRFHGIKYPSSKNGRGCCVLFVEQDECLPSKKPRTRPQVLSLVRGSRTTVTYPSRRKPK